MKAILLKNSGKVVVEEMSLPKLDSGDVLVEMSVCGLCGTDIEKLHGQYTAAAPVLGHEAVGLIADVGQDVIGLKVGDRVFPHHHTPCRVCYYCKKGNETMCSKYRSSNLDPSGFAEYFRVPSWNIKQGGVLKIPKNVSFEEASLIEPVACCLRGLSRARVSKGDTVLVVGAGPVGITHLQLLRNIGAKVLVSDINKKRLSFAEGQGASAIYNALDDVSSKIRSDTSGVGVDISLVASGNPKAILQALKSVRKGGVVCLFGIPVVGSILDYDFSNVFNNEVSIVSSYGATENETMSALNLIEKHNIDAKSLISDRFNLDEFEEAVETAEKGDCMKIIITP